MQKLPESERKVNTAISIDPDVAAFYKESAKETRLSFSALVNQVLRAEMKHKQSWNAPKKGTK